MKKIGYGCSFLGGTIINAISTYSGSSFGINLKSYAKVELDGQKKKKLTRVMTLV